MGVEEQTIDLGSFYSIGIVCYLFNLPSILLFGPQHPEALDDRPDGLFLQCAVGSSLFVSVVALKIFYLRGNFIYLFVYDSKQVQKLIITPLCLGTNTTRGV